MLRDAPTFSGFSVKDQAKAKEFYEQTLGLKVEEDKMGLHLKLKGGEVFVYAKPDHTPATFTVLNFIVNDIDATVKDLAGNGITFESYDFGNGAKTDESGVMRGLAAKMGPDIAWFKDPDGNTLAVLQEA
jgi:catechol 2,3-dioxygenase-like lactoylglutathione lyase family enzyme